MLGCEPLSGLCTSSISGGGVGVADLMLGGAAAPCSDIAAVSLGGCAAAAVPPEVFAPPGVLVPLAAFIAPGVLLPLADDAEAFLLALSESTSLSICPICLPYENCRARVSAGCSVSTNRSYSSPWRVLSNFSSKVSSESRKVEVKKKETYESHNCHTRAA